MAAQTLTIHKVRNAGASKLRRLFRTPGRVHLPYRFAEGAASWLARHRNGVRLDRARRPCGELPCNGACIHRPRHPTGSHFYPNMRRFNMSLAATASNWCCRATSTRPSRRGTSSTARFEYWRRPRDKPSSRRRSERDFRADTNVTTAIRLTDRESLAFSEYK